MQRDDFVEVEARVMECLQNNLFQLQLANGHRLLGHFSEKIPANENLILPGMVVRVGLRVFDLSVGRIFGVVKPLPSKQINV